jgi:hypothetical protein
MQAAASLTVFLLLPHTVRTSLDNLAHIHLHLHLALRVAV